MGTALTTTALSQGSEAGQAGTQQPWAPEMGEGRLWEGFPGRTRKGVRGPGGEQSSALTTTSFDVLRSVVFFYIKSPLRVEEAGLQELIPTTWWPHRSPREVSGPEAGGRSHSEG